jgi:hypothetical protein
MRKRALIALFKLYASVGAERKTAYLRDMEESEKP